MNRKDETIKKEVVDQLYWDNRVDADDVTVHVDNGVVTLKGTVHTHGARSSAVTDTWMIDGVTSVEDQIDVELAPTVEIPTDAEVRNNIQNILSWNTDIDIMDIDVSVEGGVVTLEGTVDEYWKKWKAVELVSDVSGVIDVLDEMTVVPTGSFIDKDIAETINDALDRNLYIDAEDITVEVEHGKVTLTGVVPTNFVRSKAGDIASYTAGVIDVHNNLVVG
ncbi:MAG: BON domain-containing protein [Anaerolineales bacterium]|nr:BON domain-containing protein [Anaerolineales bacterium]